MSLEPVLFVTIVDRLDSHKQYAVLTQGSIDTDNITIIKKAKRIPGNKKPSVKITLKNGNIIHCVGKKSDFVKIAS